MAAQTLALREKGSEYTLSSQISDSRTAYALSLYAKISNITWDYEAPSGKIAGCEYVFFARIYCNPIPNDFSAHNFTAGVGNDRTKTFKSFSIDSRSNTSFEVANSLWDLIGEGFETEK